MNEPKMIKVVAPIDEIELMRAFEMCIASAQDEPLNILPDDEIRRAVDWLHAKWGSKRDV